MSGMQIAITGGTGTVGSELVSELARRGHEVRVLTRRAPGRLPGGAQHHRVDLATGEGIAAALDGVDAVVDAANSPPKRTPAEQLLVHGTGRLLKAEAAVGVAHHVAISIVGIDRVPGMYYETKLRQEAAVKAAGVPWTIVRATQFHALVDDYLRRAARFGVLPGVALPLQPVHEREVAVVLADTVEAEPSGATTQFAGPDRRTIRELAQTWRLETGHRAAIVPFPVPGKAGRALRDGAFTNPGAWTGRATFGDWLRERREGVVVAPASASVGLAA
jgi:uncharacterized protein YbjT (DUF2867 family)